VLDDKYYLIKEQLTENPEVDCWSIQGRHYYWHLNREDAQFAEHWWINRLFKNNGLIKYKEGMAHGLPEGYKNAGRLKGLFVHHYSAVKGACLDLSRYQMNYGEKKEIHTDEYLNEWLRLRLTGVFPTKEVSLSEHPKLIKDKFFMERWNK
jgi:hypothetical protein